METSKNIIGKELEACCLDPVTGFYRNGFCETGPDDSGTHVVCSQMTKEFLSFTKARGNDLTTPSPLSGFPGLKPGDKWCLCVSRWKEALEADLAPPVVSSATHEAALRYVKREDLKKHAVDA
jgi:uncharacterized protein (DUF2237 family)